MILSSVIAGVILAAGIIGYNVVYPGEPLDTNIVPEIVESIAGDNQPIGRSSSTRKINTRGDDFRKIQEESYRLEASATWLNVLQWAMLIVLIGSASYMLQLATHGDFGRILQGLFAKELEALSLKPAYASSEISAEL